MTEQPRHWSELLPVSEEDEFTDFASRLDNELCEPCACGSGKSYLLCGKDESSLEQHRQWEKDNPFTWEK